MNTYNKKKTLFYIKLYTANYIIIFSIGNFNYKLYNINNI